MTEAVAAAAALPRPRAGLRSTSRGRRMPEESSINAPDIGSPKPSAAQANRREDEGIALGVVQAH